MILRQVTFHLRGAHGSAGAYVTLEEDENDALQDGQIFMRLGDAKFVVDVEEFRRALRTFEEEAT